MRLICGMTIAVLAALPALGQDASRAVTGGGISVPGWVGAVDARAQKAGQTINDTRMSQQGDILQVTTGPAASFWNPANTASGSYTVSATFNEAKYMNLNTHPHPYGVFIAGHDLGTDQATELYCAAYGDGRFIVRGFGPDPFSLIASGKPEANAAVHKAAGPGQPVEQKIALSVTDDKVQCAINDVIVASYSKTSVVGPGLLKATDGIYGIRFAHNTEGTVSGLKLTKP